jgi:hypothetical protein
VVVVNNMAGPPVVPGINDPSITIPAVMIRREDGDRLFDAIGGQGPAPTPPAPPPPGNPGPTPTPPAPPPKPPNSGPSTTLHPTVSSEPPSTCTPNDGTLCLERGRFRVRARWTTRQGATGAGHAVSLTGDSGHFWFFDPANVEIVLKVKNACGAPFNHYWFFAAGLTDVDTVIEVADTKTGRVLTYHNPQARPFPAVQDTDAFPTCP